MGITGISWAQHVWNPLSGCTPVSPGCLECYAARMSHRLGCMGQEKYTGLTVKRGGRHVFNGTIKYDEKALLAPLRRRTPTVYFVNSMSDLFHENVPDEFIDRCFAVMALCPQHTFQVLTKRPERMASYMAAGGRPGSMGQWWCDAQTRIRKAMEDLFYREDLREYMGPSARGVEPGGRSMWNGVFPLPNVWLGTSVESQEYIKRVWSLLKCPAAIRFVSAEPLLGFLDFNAIEALCKTWRRGATIGTYLDWVITGCESRGNGLGRFAAEYPEAARQIIAQCAETKTACWHKQMPVGNTASENPDEWPEPFRVRQMPEAR
jgi:protein gp37